MHMQQTIRKHVAVLCPGLRMLGVVLKPSQGQPFEAARLEQVASCPEGVHQNLATCHGLAVLQGQVAGDSLDRQLFTASGWQLSQVSAPPCMVHHPLCSEGITGVLEGSRRIMRIG